MRFILALLAFVFAFPALADHTSFYVINRSPVALLQVFATSVVNRSFGYDLLGESVIQPGARRLVRPSDNRGCVFDVMFAFYGGHSVNRRNLDLCTITELSTTGQGVGVPRRHERPRTYQDFNALQLPRQEPILREVPRFTRGHAI
jgi:hypothetical protein